MMKITRAKGTRIIPGKQGAFCRTTPVRPRARHGTCSVLLGFLLTVPHPSFANYGDTMRQSKSRFGHPVGEMSMDGKTILVYETSHGKITETYDKSGICIASDAPHRKASAPTPAKSDKAVLSRTKQQTKLKQAHPPDEENMLATPDGTSAVDRKPIPWTTIILILGTVAAIGSCIVFVMLRKKSELHIIHPPDEINALSDFIQRQSMEPAPENSDQTYCKNHEPAA